MVDVSKGRPGGRVPRNGRCGSGRGVGGLQEMTILEGDVVLGEVGHLNQAQALLGAIEAQTHAVGGEVDGYGL